MNKKITSILILFLGLPMSVIADSLDCPCQVIKITSGDTVVLLDQSKTNHKIRLSGIDAPEMKQHFGKQSKQNLSSLIAGKSIKVEYRKLDSYGRIIGKLIYQGRDINLLQIKQGYAWHDRPGKKDQSPLDRALYGSAELVARKQTIGLWSAPAIPPWEFRRK